MRVGLWRKLSTKELMLLKCDDGEDFGESLGLSNSKGNQPWIFIGRTDAEAETPILWPPEVKSQLIGKDPAAGKDWRWEEKGVTDDEMVGCHHPLTWWTWVWVSSGSWWWTEKPGVLQSMGSQRVRHSWATELNTPCCAAFCTGFRVPEKILISVSKC